MSSNGESSIRSSSITAFSAFKLPAGRPGKDANGKSLVPGSKLELSLPWHITASTLQATEQ
jgi:hypothetical protein